MRAAETASPWRYVKYVGAGSAALHVKHSIGHRNLNGRVTGRQLHACMPADSVVQAMARCEPMDRPLLEQDCAAGVWLVAGRRAILVVGQRDDGSRHVQVVVVAIACT